MIIIPRTQLQQPSLSPAHKLVTFGHHKYVVGAAEYKMADPPSPPSGDVRS